MQGPRRAAESEGSVEQSRDPMDRNRKRGLPGRTGKHEVAKSVPIKGWLVLVLAAVALQSGAASWAQGQLPLLTLRQAVLVALAENERVVASLEDMERARLGRILAGSVFATRVTPNLLGSFGQSDVRNQTYGVGVSRRFTTGTEVRLDVGASTFSNQIGNFYATDTTLLVQQSLLRGFGPRAGRRDIERADYRIGNARRRRVAVQQQVAIDVARSYYGLIAGQELVAVAHTALENAQQLLEASEAKLEAQLVSQLDVFRARQLLADADARLFDAESAVEDQKDELRILMSRDLDYDFRVAAELDARLEPMDLADAVARALQNRIELRDADAEVEEAEREVRFMRHRLLPQVDVSVAMTRRQSAEGLRGAFGLDRFEPVTFFSVSTPLDRTAENTQLESAKMERDRRARERDVLRRRIAVEARRAVREQQRLANAVESADTTVEFAEREVALATLRFQRGLSNNLDVVNAQAALLDATARRLGVLSDVAVSRLALRATLGILDVRRDIR